MNKATFGNCGLTILQRQASARSAHLQQKRDRPKALGRVKRRDSLNFPVPHPKHSRMNKLP
jgi:hypothetical protein